MQALNESLTGTVKEGSNWNSKSSFILYTLLNPCQEAGTVTDRKIKLWKERSHTQHNKGKPMKMQCNCYTPLGAMERLPETYRGTNSVSQATKGRRSISGKNPEEKNVWRYGNETSWSMLGNTKQFGMKHTRCTWRTGGMVLGCFQKF